MENAVTARTHYDRRAEPGNPHANLCRQSLEKVSAAEHFLIPSLYGFSKSRVIIRAIQQ
jgi:hypothetical protein